MGRILTLLAKEMLDIKRDVKSIALIVVSAWLLPLLALFSQGLQQVSVANVLVIDNDCGRGIIDSSVVAKLIKAGLEGYAPIPVNVTLLLACSSSSINISGYDVVVVVPRGFTANITSFMRYGVIRVYYNPASNVASQLYEWIVYTLVPTISRIISEDLVKALARKAGVSVEPGVVLDPIRVEKGYIGVAPAAAESVEKAIQAAHFLAFATIFVFAPAAMLASDLFASEKERRNLELILSTPASITDVVVAKLLASSILAGLAGLLDAAAVTAYMHLSGYNIAGIPAHLVVIHAVSTFLAIGVTAALTALPILAGFSSRAVSILSSIYTLLAFFVYTASLAVDYTRLPEVYRLLLSLIPYTHSANAVIYAARGDLVSVAMSLSILSVFLVACIIASRFASIERIVRSE